jgi:hypothetical protein
MKVLICKEDRELKRIESAIAAIQSAPPQLRRGKMLLLSALQSERVELMRYSGRVRVKRRMRIARAA